MVAVEVVAHGGQVATVLGLIVLGIIVPIKTRDGGTELVAPATRRSTRSKPARSAGGGPSHPGRTGRRSVGDRAPGPADIRE